MATIDTDRSPQRIREIHAIWELLAVLIPDVQPIHPSEHVDRAERLHERTNGNAKPEGQCHISIDDEKPVCVRMLNRGIVPGSHDEGGAS